MADINLIASMKARAARSGFRVSYGSDYSLISGPFHSTVGGWNSLLGTESFPMTGITLVRSNGTDGQYDTLELAKAAGSSGDVVVVGPGDYTIQGNLAKDGLDWFFLPGAAISPTSGVIGWDFRGTTGSGKIVGGDVTVTFEDAAYTPTADYYTGLVAIDNDLSHVLVETDSLTIVQANSASTFVGAVCLSSKGRLTYRNRGTLTYSDDGGQQDTTLAPVFDSTDAFVDANVPDLHTEGAGTLVIMRAGTVTPEGGVAEAGAFNITVGNTSGNADIFETARTFGNSYAKFTATFGSNGHPMAFAGNRRHVVNIADQHGILRLEGGATVAATIGSAGGFSRSEGGALFENAGGTLYAEVENFDGLTTFVGQGVYSSVVDSSNASANSYIGGKVFVGRNMGEGDADASLFVASAGTINVMRGDVVPNGIAKSFSQSSTGIIKVSGAVRFVPSFTGNISPGELLLPIRTQFDKTNSATLGLAGGTVRLEAGKSYYFRANFTVVPDAVGGHKYATGGTATATAIRYTVHSVNDATGLVVISSTQTAMAGPAGESTSASVSAKTVVEGTITVNAAGTFGIQFAQNTATSATTSSVMIGSTMYYKQLS